MKSEYLSIILAVGAFILGATVGLAFGSLQNAAILRFQKQKQQGKEGQGHSFLPGSASRIGFLLIVLMVVQIACPMLFSQQSLQWIVTAGVVLGYGWTLKDQLRLRTTHCH